MSLRINDEAPNFTAETTQGKITFHDWLGNGWGVLFSHPKDFTPVCTTELGYMAKLQPEFQKRNVKVIGLSVDPVKSHNDWEKDIQETQGTAVNFPMIGDHDLAVANCMICFRQLKQEYLKEELPRQTRLSALCLLSGQTRK